MRTREAAVRAAQDQNFNTPGTCQATVRGWFDAPSVGDVDHDGLPDAEDGWRAEPVEARHPGDRMAPLGVPLSWLGGTNDAGHRAISLGVPKGASECLIRSTDAGGSGRIATVTLSWIENNWHLTYVGWSETMSRILIPRAPKPETHVTLGRDHFKIARDNAKQDGNLRRARRLTKALEVAPWR